ncbi:MAG: AAA family ATPase, partial [Sphingobacteriia bacterium]|nr:AAA family ATPase [Sphingobacteriia bacterium]
MRLELKQLNITRFRGLQNISFSFEEPETWIYGRNGSGKTSLFDSFVWCLFGKDHLGRADYEIKPYDKAGKIIPRTDVEVEAIILVDGAMRKLRRCYQEVWVKPKTEIEEVSKGHTTEYFIDDVKVSKSRYDNLVSTLCDDIVFKTITNPLFFTSLKQDEQRKLLFSMVSITDEEIAEENDDFKKLLSDLTGISIEEYKKSINTQKARIKPELTGLPERIAGLKEGMPEMPDEARISSEISLKQALVDEIEQALNDAAANAENQNRVRM